MYSWHRARVSQLELILEKSHNILRGLTVRLRESFICNCSETPSLPAVFSTHSNTLGI